MHTVVISQPFFFPWVGLFEQWRLADSFVHYDDVQFSKGSFCNRVQIKTARGMRWLTVPLQRWHLGQCIHDLVPDDRQPWRQRHRQLLHEAWEAAPFRQDAEAVVEAVYAAEYPNLAALAIASLESIADYFALERPARHVSSQLHVPGRNSDRVLEIVRHLQGTRYVTGHGARNYLNHLSFEAHGIVVEYMDYQKRPYTQLHGPFTPYVSALDLIANLGPQGAEFIRSPTIGWRAFLARSEPHSAVA